MLCRLSFSLQYQKTFQWRAKGSMFHLHYFIIILSLFSPSTLLRSPLPSEYVHWSECLFLNCVVIFSHYLQPHCAVFVLKYIYIKYISCGIYRSLFNRSAWGSSLPGVKLRKTFSFRSKLSRTTFSVVPTESLRQEGTFQDHLTQFPCSRLLHHLPRNWLSLTSLWFSRSYFLLSKADDMVKMRTRALKSEIYFFPVFRNLFWLTWSFKENEEHFFHTLGFVPAYFIMLQSSPEMKPT